MATTLPEEEYRLQPSTSASNWGERGRKGVRREGEVGGGRGNNAWGRGGEGKEKWGEEGGTMSGEEGEKKREYEYMEKVGNVQ